MRKLMLAVGFIGAFAGPAVAADDRILDLAAQMMGAPPRALPRPPAPPPVNREDRKLILSVAQVRLLMGEAIAQARLADAQQAAKDVEADVQAQLSK